MRIRLAVAAALALGQGVLASDASALSLTLVATGPTLLRPGETSSFEVVALLDQPVTSATAILDSTRASAIVFRRGTSDLTGTGLGIANFALRDPSFNQVGSCAPFAGGFGGSRTCHDAGIGAASAGNVGGLSIAGSNTGTFTIGSFTIQAIGVGGSTLRVRFRSGDFEWLDGRFNSLGFPATNTLRFDVVPEPATAALIGLGFAGLLVASRRSDPPGDPG